MCIVFFYTKPVNADTPNDFSGLYWGAGFGISHLQTSQHFQFDENKVARVNRYNSDFKLSNQYGVAHWMLGYQRDLPKLIWAGMELNLQLSRSAHLIYDDIEFHNSTPLSISILLRSGIRIKQWQLYGLGGLNVSQSKQTIHFAQGGLYQSGMMFLDKVTQRNTLFIKTLGAGLERALNMNLALRLEYTHQFLPNAASYALNHSVITYNNPKGYACYGMTYKQIMLGFRYRMAG